MALVRATLRSRLSDDEYAIFKPEHIDVLFRAGFSNTASIENLFKLADPASVWVKVFPEFWAGFCILMNKFGPSGKHAFGMFVTSGFLVPGKLDWRNGRVEKLLELYRLRCVDARAVSDCRARAPTTPLPDKLDYRNLGKYFSIVGRKSTLRAIMSANIAIFQTFRKSFEQMGSQDFLKQTLLTSVIAFPGAGKTSLGRCLGRLWQHRLHKDGWDTTEQLYNFVVGIRDTDGFKQWRAMVEKSLTFEFVMYHNVVVDCYEKGYGPLLEEKGMSSTNILALRTLHGTLIRTVEEDAFGYRSFLVELEEQAPGLKFWMTMDDVVEFIRRALTIPAGQKLMLVWYFDGLNRAQRQERSVPSFMQAALGVYAEWMDARRDSSTFVTILVGTNRYQVATLADTGISSSAKAMSVPIRPLHQARHYQKAYKIFVSRLKGFSGSVTISSEMDTLLQLAGGNPRLLSYVLRACATSGMDCDISNADYLALLEGGILNSTVMGRVWALASSSYYNGYKSNNKFRCVLRAVQASLLGHKVARSEAVLDDGSNADTWGDIEAVGLVGFLQEQACTTEGELRNRVVFSPLILHSIFTRDQDDFCKVMPDLMTLATPDWQGKEETDLYSVLFNILVVKHLKGDLAFGFADVLPAHWYIPPRLQSLEFKMPRFPVDVFQASICKSGEGTNVDGSTWTCVGDRNSESDAYIILELVSGGFFILFLESKCCGNPLKLLDVTWMDIKAKMRQDIAKAVHVPRGRDYIGRSCKEPYDSKTDSKWELENIGFLFLSDQNVLKAARLEHQQECELGAVPLTEAECCIIGAGHPDGSALSLVSSIRHVAKFQKQETLRGKAPAEDTAEKTKATTSKPPPAKRMKYYPELSD